MDQHDVQRIIAALESIADSLEVLSEPEGPVALNRAAETAEETRDEKPLLLKVEAAARLLRVSRGQAYAMAASGELPVVRFGRSVRVHRAQLEALMETRTNGAMQ